MLTHLMLGGSGDMPPRKILDPLRSLLVHFQVNLHVVLRLHLLHSVNHAYERNW